MNEKMPQMIMLDNGLFNHGRKVIAAWTGADTYLIDLHGGTRATELCPLVQT